MRVEDGHLFNSLADQSGIRGVLQRQDRNLGFAQYTVCMKYRDVARHELHMRGILTAVHYPLPVNKQPTYRHLCCLDCTPNSDLTASGVLSLQMRPYLSNDLQQTIFSALNK